MTAETHALYEAADAILHACTHAQRTAEVSLPTGGLLEPGRSGGPARRPHTL